MNGDQYLVSYADIGIHRLMLEDEPRTLAYKNAIFANKSAFDGKVILDVGCGTGILSIFCAQAGAKKVHAVECSSIATVARKVVSDNGFNDVITVHECCVEELVLEEKVDVIVSEWMGFYLLHEGMLESVIFARDRFLARNGMIFPESADIWAAACELPQFFEKWDDVYGVRMSAVGRAERSSRSEPAVTTVQPTHLLTEPSVLFSFSLATVSLATLERVQSKLMSPSKRTGKYQGICLWFIVNFPSEGGEWHKLSTAPDEPPTHWKQTAIVFPGEIEVEQGQPIAYEITLSIKENDRRKYNMELSMIDAETVEHPVPCDCYMTKCIVIRKYLENSINADDDGIEEEEVMNDE